LPRSKRFLEVAVAISAEEFRVALATRAGGVAVVTSRAGDEIHGMTVTDWAGVSVDPPLALVCADKKSNTLGVIESGGCFAINVLAAGLEELSNRFASKQDEEKRFENLAYEKGVTGAPLLAGAVTCLDCRVVSKHEAGDHWVLIGEIETSIVRGGEPLVYCGGGYQRLVPTS
jgi:flavin reductase (DIM6/NTAB) family NADH-FMN oxidoreductase RutF